MILAMLYQPGITAAQSHGICLLWYVLQAQNTQSRRVHDKFPVNRCILVAHGTVDWKCIEDEQKQMLFPTLCNVPCLVWHVT